MKHPFDPLASRNSARWCSPTAREELYKDIIIGRAPQINEAMAGRQRAVAVPSPKKDLPATTVRSG